MINWWKEFCFITTYVDNEINVKTNQENRIPSDNEFMQIKIS